MRTGAALICAIFAYLVTAATATAVTGKLYLGDSEVVSDLTQDGSGTGWTWDAASATLELDNSYNSGGNIYFEAAGDVTVTVTGTVSAAAIKNNYTNAGKLTITGNGTLNLNYTANDGNPAIVAKAGLEIAGATVNVSTTGSSSCVGVITGDFTMSSGTLNMSAAGANAEGILCQGGLNISGTAQVKTNPSVTGIAMSASTYDYNGSISISGSAVVDVASSAGYGISTDGGVTISGGNVKVKGGYAAAFKGDVTVTGGVLVTGESDANGGIEGNLTVSDASADVTVNGGIGNNGNLTVSAGDVEVTGTVTGNTTVTGGNVTVNGSPVAAYVAEINLATVSNGTSGAGYSVSNNTITFNTAGNYRVYGTTAVYRLYVTADNVSLSLDGASVTQTYAAALISMNSNTTLTLSGTNTLEGFNGIGTLGGEITINGDGSLTATGVNAAPIAGSVNITGGRVTVDGAGVSSAAGVAVSGNVTVSGTADIITISGNVSGDLAVSAGTVTVTGTVAGTTTVTGGTVSVDGQTVPPSGGGNAPVIIGVTPLAAHPGKTRGKG